ncbi:uncharacterized protein SPSK_03780 [Sporothrix schenckii 1099-18]|uniref:Uncharacterized protein n=1 Tax=Sporothrix schenckii 1099-18 TaxID=1397361 RepID=A0A0F2M0H0_SPOSC|nr:uncharacterized protein SPSK_03780 [Sporothrix schenckii 1099-18]KJR82569.1 hypothetical protein SPSK_03780 [Sporothrix schenckii 1099-18]
MGVKDMRKNDKAMAMTGDDGQHTTDSEDLSKTFMHNGLVLGMDGLNDVCGRPPSEVVVALSTMRNRHDVPAHWPLFGSSVARLANVGMRCPVSW